MVIFNLINMVKFYFKKKIEFEDVGEIIILKVHANSRMGLWAQSVH
jgi:hypothetical protein